MTNLRDGTISQSFATMGKLCGWSPLIYWPTWPIWPLLLTYWLLGLIRLTHLLTTATDRIHTHLLTTATDWLTYWPLSLTGFYTHLLTTACHWLTGSFTYTHYPGLQLKTRLMWRRQGHSSLASQTSWV